MSLPYNAGMHRPIERVVDLLDPRVNQLHNVDVGEARRRVLSGDPGAVRAIDGSFALVAVDGITVRMARSLDRPMRYFLAKRHEGPALLIADRIDALQRALREAGLDGQFHPSYTRMRGHRGHVPSRSGAFGARRSHRSRDRALRHRRAARSPAW